MTSATGLATITSALPALSSGVRLNEVVADARARYDALAAADTAAAQPSEFAAEYAEAVGAYTAEQDPSAAAEAVAA